MTVVIAAAATALAALGWWAGAAVAHAGAPDRMPVIRAAAGVDLTAQHLGDEERQFE